MRHFYRCEDCLSVVATEVAIRPTYKPGTYYPQYANCDACGGDIEYMGQVCRDHLEKTALVCACDDRCTSALGPMCSCRCGGENHGTNRVVEIVIETGKLPRLLVPPDAKVKADEYRALLAEVRSAIDARYGRLFQQKRDGRFLSTPEFSQFCEGQRISRDMHKARVLRTHSGRNKKLRAILAELAAAPGSLGVCA